MLHTHQVLIATLIVKRAPVYGSNCLRSYMKFQQHRKKCCIFGALYFIFKSKCKFFVQVDYYTYSKTSVTKIKRRSGKLTLTITEKAISKNQASYSATNSIDFEAYIVQHTFIFSILL